MITLTAPALLTATCLVVALTGTLAGCSTGSGEAVARVITCVGPDEQHPAGTPVHVSLRQGGVEVAGVDSRYGQLVSRIVPSAQTAVFADGTEIGWVGFGGPGSGREPESLPAPDAATIRAAEEADPAAVEGSVALTGPGCPDADTLDVG